MHNNRYIIIFVLIMTTIVAVVLAGLFTALKSTHDKNELIFNKRAVLSAVETYLEKPVKEYGDEEIESIFASKIQQVSVDMEGNTLDAATLQAAGYKGGKAENIDNKKEKKKPEADRILPLFVFDNGQEKFYIVNVRGNGLWDEIWGNIALKDDFNTIVGTAFDHTGETPGLGAEIKDNPTFPARFVGKKIYDDNGIYQSVSVMKGGAKDPYHEVDGISGATITANGVSEMMVRGMKYYEPYFKNLN
ncbi:MAG: NADH:ubiquinone reductase (Na(+)-transporting) subunit C [Bacteroidota bacterium]